MRKRNAFQLVPLAVGLALFIVLGGAASAEGTSPGGEVHAYEADTSLAGHRGTVILTGAITDHGIDHQGVPEDGTNRLELSKGSFSVYVNDLGNKLAAMPVDPVTCSADGSATAAVPIIDGSGTGAYRGISGTFVFTGTTAAILPRLPSGECDTNATKYWGILLAQGSGTVSFK
jgi:hypothetical protein